MLQKVSIGRHCYAPSANVENHRALVGDDLVDEIAALARDLKGVRIAHVNSTAFGGGVAELLARHLPVLQALGVTAEWRLIHGEPEFFTVTKAFHNALQGAHYDLGERERNLYLEANRQAAQLLEHEYDVIVVHDPQPAALRHFAGARGAKWIWRCHIDSSAADATVREFLAPFIAEYDALVFTMAEFLLPGLDGGRAAFIAPAIDPLATKNMDLPLDVCRRAIADSGVDVNRPLLVQVSRFDPWKDPLGAIHAYRLVKQEVPDVQLALIGAMAGDDPEGWTMLERVEEEAAQDPDLFVFTNLAGVGSMEVNVFQRGSDVVIQKSLREGFGLVVSEALWKEKPVVAGRAGGIPMQFPPGFDRYLVDSVEACAAEVIHLLGRPGERGDFGRAGREHVRRRFLLPRLVRDELALIRRLV
ncbi:MAG: glycosyl transferase family 1 [Candidatus Rokubacteria bacterium RIFCSPHIGHO2_12_FULL_73_22]|nr:MAG: glycosyl transferase family 1 [Candidatus Rokubacteria bacterium RIFCSPHIGHO2_02_FULL_73_26]OGL03493.1 MAG: glycosyl transferase family 1 [Candidatus Rokubacteria bacterium RIFCSPHIGHO2_12_FULL_73_22]